MALFPRTIPLRFAAPQDCLSSVISYNINPNVNFESVNEPPMLIDDPDSVGDTRPGQFGRQITRESVSQQAYMALRNSLMRSRLKPGQKLIARQVADELGISVTPVRESLLRLVSEHALNIDDRGTVVVPILALERCVDISDLRMGLDGEGAARAALTGTGTQ